MNGLAINVFGRKGHGKSTLAMHWALRLSNDIAIFDPCAQFSRFHPVRTPDDLQQALNDGDESVVVYLPSVSVREEFSVFADALEFRENYSLIVDEASELQTPNQIEPALSRMVRQGHRSGINLIQTAHRPQDLHNRSRALADVTCFFRTSLQRDLDVVTEQFGSEVANKIAELPDHVPLVWYEEEERYAIWEQPDSWYVRIHATLEEELEDAGKLVVMSGKESEEKNAKAV